MLSSVSSAASTDSASRAPRLVEIAGARTRATASCVRAARLEPVVAEPTAELVDLGEVRAARPRLGRATISSIPTVSAANATNGSFCARKPSSAVDAARSAPSKSSTIGRIHETASCAALSRYGSSMRPSSRSMPSTAASALSSSPTSTAVTAAREQQLGSGAVVQCVGAEPHLVDPRPALGHAVAHLPEQPEDAEDVGQRRDVVGEEPTDGDSQVLLLGAQALGPLGLSLRGPVGVLHERTEVLRVPPLDVGPLGAGGEALGGELPDRREHAEPRPGVGRVDAHEAVPGERIEQIERVVLGEIGDADRRVDRPSVDEDRQGGQHAAAPRRRAARRSTRRSPRNVR